MMRRVGEIDAYAVLSGRKTLDDDRLAARVDPVPLRVVDRHVNMADARYNLQACFPKHFGEPQMFCAILKYDESPSERVREGRGDDQAGRRLRRRRSDRRRIEAGLVRCRIHSLVGFGEGTRAGLAPTRMLAP
jgi:hypothetical protein